jgi:hypothetical protein
MPKKKKEKPQERKMTMAKTMEKKRKEDGNGLPQEQALADLPEIDSALSPNYLWHSPAASAKCTSTTMCLH